MHATQSRLRVAYFVPPSSIMAGVERVVHEIATGLVEEDSDHLDVHVIFATRYDDELIARTSYTRHVLDTDRLRNLGPALRACVAENRFDVLVCPQVEPSVIAWIATRGLGVAAFVPHLHGNPRIEQKRGSRRTKLAFALFRYLVGRRVAAVLTVSPALREYVAESVAPCVPVYFARNPVRALDATDPNPRVRVDTDPFHLLCVARLDHQKGIDVLLQAMASARDVVPTLRLSIVGSGPDGDRLKDLSRTLGVDDIVEFVGHRTDPTEHYRAADCFVLASRWEGFGVVLIEALQFGLPLVAADCDFGPSDIVTDPRIGELVATEDPTALAAGIARAARRPDGHRDIRRAAAAGYLRAAATRTHVDVLRAVATARSHSSERLASFATQG